MVSSANLYPNILWSRSLCLGILTRAVTSMKKNQPIATNTPKYNNHPQVDVDELAEKWVEMLFETISLQDKKGLQKSDLFSKLDTA